MNSLKYRLGLDVGSKSLGWWIWEEDDSGEVVRSVDGGVVIYSDGREAKTSTSKAVARRVARGMRRRRDRYLKRRTRLMLMLIDVGLLPSNLDERKRIERLDPYRLRARSLDEVLEPYELGRALFHLNQRRGFQSNRIVDSSVEITEQRKIGDSIEQLDQILLSSKYRTIGEYLFHRRSTTKSTRFRPGDEIYPRRKHYEDEFDLIRETQEPNQRLSSQAWDELKEIIFFQRDLRPVDPGKCSILPEESRAPKALPTSQKFRFLQEANNLKVIEIGEEERPLSEVEREQTFRLLASQAQLKFSALRKRLKLRLDSKFNLEDSKRGHLDGDQTSKILRKPAVFGKEWDRMSTDEQTKIVKVLLTREARNEVEEVLVRQWHVSPETAKAVALARLPQGYINISERATEAILPYLEMGLRYHEAVQKAFPERDHSATNRGKELDSLPYYPELLERHVSRGTNNPNHDVFRKLGKIANPTVHIGLNQVRKVVNALITRYGKPSRIMVELARDLKNSAEEKLEISRQQKELQAKNDQRREQIQNWGVHPSPDYLRKVRLWEEQGPPQARCCPYCGKVLSYEAVLDQGTQVDHILPFSRTLDDSLANKVVCCSSCNQEKGNKTPYEAFGSCSGDKHDYDKMLVRVSKEWKKNKRWRFFANAMDRIDDEEGGFLDRQLNDTRYLSRLTKTYLEFLFDSPTKVSVNPGRLTALMRGKWGLNLNSILSDSDDKKRTDHRHHAIDAAVIALIDRAMLQRVSTAAAQGATGHRLISRMPEPLKCGDFRSQIENKIHRLIVVHRPRHKVQNNGNSSTAGQLHNDTAFGIVEGPSAKGTYTVVRRVPLRDVSQEDGVKLLKGVHKRKTVRDDTLRFRLLKLWIDFESQGDTWDDFCRFVSQPNPVFKFGVRQLRCTETKDSLVEIRDQEDKIYKGYKPAGNAYMEVYRLSNGKYGGMCTSVFEASRAHEVRDWKKRDPKASLVTRLSMNELIAIGLGNERKIYRIVKLSRSNVWIAPTYEGGKHRIPVSKSSSKLVQEGLRKLKVDPLGQIFDPGPISLS